MLKFKIGRLIVQIGWKKFKITLKNGRLNNNNHRERSA